MVKLLDKKILIDQCKTGIRLKKEIIAELKIEIKECEDQLKKLVAKKEDKHEKRESKLRSKDVQSLVRRTRRKV